MSSLCPSSHSPHSTSLVTLDHPGPWAWKIEDFGGLLHESHAEHGVIAIQYCNCPHLASESVILDVVPLAPGSYIPQRNTKHTYLKFGQGFRWELFPRYHTDDLLVSDSQQAVQGSDSCIATFSWVLDQVPNHVDVFDIIKLHWFMLHDCNFITRPWFWFARKIYRTLRSTYGYAYREAVGDEFWKRTWFPLPLLLSFARDKKQSREIEVRTRARAV